MILLDTELNWVKDRMNIYDIKYQEIYDEVLDHILTAIEDRRKTGNIKEISVLFQNVVDEQFGGYAGIKALAKTQEHTHQKRVKLIFFNSPKSRFYWQLMVIAVILIAVPVKIPDSGAIHIFFILIIFFLAVSPVMYAYSLLAGKIETIKGKRSLFKGYLLTQMALPLMRLPVICVIIFLIDKAIGVPPFSSIERMSTTRMMGFVIYFSTIFFGHIQTCRYMIEKKLNSFRLH